MIRNYFKFILSAALFTVLISTADTASAQIGNGNYLIVQFVIEGLEDNYHASELDEQLRAHPDIWMSRSDHLSSNYLGFFDPNTQLDAEELGTMLSALGLSLKCYLVSPNDGSLINELDPSGCDAALPDTESPYEAE